MAKPFTVGGRFDYRPWQMWKNILETTAPERWQLFLNRRRTATMTHRGTVDLHDYERSDCRLNLLLASRCRTSALDSAKHLYEYPGATSGRKIRPNLALLSARTLKFSNNEARAPITLSPGTQSDYWRPTHPYLRRIRLARHSPIAGGRQRAAEGKPGANLHYSPFSA